MQHAPGANKSPTTHLLVGSINYKACHSKLQSKIFSFLHLFIHFLVADMSDLKLLILASVLSHIIAFEMEFLSCKKNNSENNTTEFPAALVLTASSEAMCGVRLKATVI